MFVCNVKPHGFCRHCAEINQVVSTCADINQLVST